MALGKWDAGMTYNASTPIRRGYDTFRGYYDADEVRHRHIYI